MEYAGDNPERWVDPDGNDFWEWRTVREGWAGIWNPRASWDTFSPIFKDKIETKNPTFNELAVRSRQKLGLSENAEHMGSQVNALRHTLWQAMLTKSYDQSTAKEIADSHEVNPDAIASEDAATKQFDTLEEADQSIDLRNNIIGRAVGEANRNVVGGPHQLAEALVQEFHEKGLWVAVQQANGKYKAARVKLTDAEFAAASRRS